MFLSSSDRLFQSLDPRKDKLSIPCLEVCALGIRISNFDQFQKQRWCQKLFAV